MLKLIVGTKGSGKTKTMIDMIDKAVKTTSGNIVVIEKCMKLTTEINHSARLVDVDEYGVAGADMLYGFVAGVLAGNYDITELFLDGILLHHRPRYGRCCQGPERHRQDHLQHRGRRHGFCQCG